MMRIPINFSFILATKIAVNVSTEMWRKPSLWDTEGAERERERRESDFKNSIRLFKTHMIFFNSNVFRARYNSLGAKVFNMHVL